MDPLIVPQEDTAVPTVEAVTEGADDNGEEVMRTGGGRLEEHNVQ